MIRFNVSQPIIRALKLRASGSVLLAALIVLGSSQAFALGLGSLHVNSFLDEPLDLLVELSVDPGVDNLEEVAFGLASPEEFSIAGIRRLDFMDEIQFEVFFENGQNWLRIFGSSPMGEPILRMLLRVDWDGGSILREYTALIDSPVNGGQLPTSVIPPTVTDDQNSASAGDSLQANQNEDAFGVYGPVEVGETLSAISVQLRQAYPELGYFETLYVLYRDNESAFIDGNMNLLKAGEVLQVNNLDDIRSMSQDVALQVFQTQRVQWLGYIADRGGSVPTYITADGTITADNTSNGVTDIDQPTTEDSGSVSAVSNSEYSEVDSTAPDEFRIGSADVVAYPGAGGNDDVRALQSEMSEMESSLLSSERENSELRTRIDLLEIQLEAVNQLIALEDPAFAALQQGLGNPNSIRAESSGEVFVGSGDNDSTPGLTFTDYSWLDKMNSFLASIDFRSTTTLGTIGAAIVAFFGLLFFRRLRAQQDMEYSMYSGDAYQAPIPEDTDSLGEHDIEASFLNVHIGGESEGESIAPSDDVDPLAEAEVYLAYGRDDQAVETLKKGLEKSADRSDIRMKLLETYCKQNNVAEFERLAERFFTDKKDSEDKLWREVVNMGRELNLTNPIFANDDDPVESSRVSGDTKDSPFDVADSGLLINLEDTAEHPAVDTNNTDNQSPEESLKSFLESTELDSSLMDMDSHDVVISEPPEFSDLMVDKSASVQDASENVVGDHEDIQTQLDLAQVYVGLGDVEGADSILKDVMENGDDQQKEQATKMLSKLTS
ncbi:MAG: hypothetical protein HOM55_01570 [Proteobacteria bacterium]|nr:hypothetical protein [Pseudomonadota bacterium]